MRDVFRFGQLPGELIESTLTRLDLVLHRGRTYSGLQLSEQALAFFLLDRLRISEHSFPFILQQLGGRLPTTPEESVVFRDSLVRHMHLTSQKQSPMARTYMVVTDDGHDVSDHDEKGNRYPQRHRDWRCPNRVCR